MPVLYEAWWAYDECWGTKKASANSPIDRLKKGMDDKEEQLNILSTFVRLGILIWAGGILTLNYVTIPRLPQDKIDPTFIASVFTGTLATFGVQAGQKKHSSSENGKVSQIIKIEQAPLKIISSEDKS